MSKIKLQLDLPVNNSLTNLLLYEGIIYLLGKNAQSQFNNNTLTISEEDFKTTISNLNDNNIETITLQFVGNDIKKPREKETGEEKPSVVQRFLQQLKIPYNEQDRIRNYGELLRLIKSHAEQLKLTTDSIRLNLSIDKAIYIGNVKDKNEGISFQLFKTERYTGITSTEYIAPTEQLTTYLSSEAVLIALLGIYSSFVTRISEKEKKENTYYFFLFFSSDKIREILSSEMGIYEMLRIKNIVREELKEIINRSFSEELLITEVLVNVSIQEKLSEHKAISEVSLLLVKIAQEGQTYKIYGLIPFIVYRRENAEQFKLLSRLLRPDGIILERLRRRDNIEYNNLLLAVIGMYRFAILHDTQGLLTMIREIHNAYHKVKTDEKMKRVAREYEDIIRELSHATKLL